AHTDHLAIVGLFVLVLLGANGVLVWAAEPATMAPVTVTAPRIPPTEAQAPTAFSTVVDTAEHTAQMETAADVLAETVGVQVRRFGGLGAFSTLSIRGSAANQVQIYMDGIPLSRARNETVNVADLPLD